MALERLHPHMPQLVILKLGFALKPFLALITAVWFGVGQPVFAEIVNIVVDFAAELTDVGVLSVCLSENGNTNDRKNDNNHAIRHQ